MVKIENARVMVCRDVTTDRDIIRIDHFGQTGRQIGVDITDEHAAAVLKPAIELLLEQINKASR